MSDAHANLANSPAKFLLGGDLAAEDEDEEGPPWDWERNRRRKITHCAISARLVWAESNNVAQVKSRVIGGCVIGLPTELLEGKVCNSNLSMNDRKAFMKRFASVKE